MKRTRLGVMLLSIDEYDRLRGNNAPGGPSGDAGSAEARCGAIVENMAEMFIAMSADLRVTEMNRVAEGYFEMPRSEIMGRHIADVLKVPESSARIEIIRRVLRSGESIVYELASSIHAGRKVKVCSFPYAGGVGCLMLNITEQERLRSSEAEWVAGQIALAQLHDVAVVKLDLRGRLTFGDDYFVNLTGFRPAEFAEVRLFEIVESHDRRRVQNVFEEVVANHRPSIARATIIHKSGDPRVLTVSMAPLLIDFSVQGVIAVLRAA